MQFLDLSLASPAFNLAADELLLELAESGAIGPTLRFWESPQHFVALGYTNKAATEANLEECRAHHVPVLRRVSGGGTVLQGPGCFNYALIHSIPLGETLNVEATNRFVMEKNRLAFEKLLGEPVEIAGHTDLAVSGKKFSGNAQRRKAKFFLFHGTALLDFDLELVQQLLNPPSKQPDYRRSRSHIEFVRNLNTSRAAVKTMLANVWEARETASFSLQDDDLQRLCDEKYDLDAWNLRF